MVTQFEYNVQAGFGLLVGLSVITAEQILTYILTHSSGFNGELEET